MFRFAQAFALSGCCAVLLLGGCNSVLGIEEAHDRDAGSSTGPLEVPVASCDAPKGDCSSCFVSATPGVGEPAPCATSWGNCVADKDCRTDLNEYRGCLGGKCSNKACSAQLKTTLGQDLAKCVTTECKQCDGASAWASMCDLYCACMEAPLPATAGAATCEAYDTASKELMWPMGSTAECTKACLALKDLTSVNCRWSHCELAVLGETPQHCEHAVSSDRCPLGRTIDGQCTTKRLDGWGCESSTQCCSNDCNANHICN
jgi:hypothetical protein